MPKMTQVANGFGTPFRGPFGDNFEVNFQAMFRCAQKQQAEAPKSALGATGDPFGSHF